MFYFTFCNVLCVSVLCCIIQVAMTFSVIKRWTHGFSKHTSLESDASSLTRYLCHDTYALLCMCCKEQLPLLFIVQKNKVWSYISVEDLGQIVCDGLHVLGLYVPKTDLLDKQICWTWAGKSVETSLGKWSIMPCHGFGENVKPGADALKQSLKTITYVICIMQHNASALTWYAVHQQALPNCPMSQ